MREGPLSGPSLEHISGQVWRGVGAPLTPTASRSLLLILTGRQKKQQTNPCEGRRKQSHRTGRDPREWQSLLSSNLGRLRSRDLDSQNLGINLRN